MVKLSIVAGLTILFRAIGGKLIKYLAHSSIHEPRDKRLIYIPSRR